MQRRNSNIIDLIKNEYFVQWIVSPTQESNHYWTKWIAAHPERKRDVELARQIINSADYRIDETMPDEHYNTVLNNIVSYSQKHNRRKVSGFPWIKLGIAASIAVILTCTYLGIQYVNTGNKDRVVQLQTVVKETKAGQKLIIRLPDGSKVMLNAESRLTYQLPFSSDRNLELSGEAFFEVARDERHPFIIRSGNITTKVLGTSFNVRAYPDSEIKAVAVVTGLVEVSDDQGNQAKLRPNMQGVFNLEKEQLLIEPFSMEKEIGWKDGALIFESTPVQEVFLRLERWYGVKFNLADSSIFEGEYTGSYKNASLEKVMQGISYAIGIDYLINKKEVVLKNLE